tara:strand:- start:3931 stop:4500 length:570 start_codon:yes stop_codon:yes gene_type:complete
MFRTAQNDEHLSGKERALLLRLNNVYTKDMVLDILVPLIEQSSSVSLRALDWTVVNWSKQHNIVCSSSSPGEMTNIHHSYRTALTYWKRRLFDPFRRRRRILVNVDGREWETTLGQSNFVLFTFETGILSYVIGHIDMIEEDMNCVSKRKKRDRFDAQRSGVTRKRTELTTARKSMCFAYSAPMRVSFD